MTAGSQRRAAVLGHPIAHSLSPALHRAAYAVLDLDWTYEAVDVTEAELEGFVAELGQEWVGLSLTMPLKESVIPLLDDIDPEAATVRAVNTVLLDEGRRRGYNTDITGFQHILASEQVGTSTNAAVLGAGATARSAVAAIAARGVASLTVHARRAEAAAELVALAASLGLGGRVGSWPPGPGADDADLVVSTVPGSVGGPDWVPREPGLLVDVSYDPWPTPLAKSWAGAGGRVVGGLELLVQQAVEQVVIMTGRRPAEEVMRRAGLEAVAARDFAQEDQQLGRRTL